HKPAARVQDLRIARIDHDERGGDAADAEVRAPALAAVVALPDLAGEAELDVPWIVRVDHHGTDRREEIVLGRRRQGKTGPEAAAVRTLEQVSPVAGVHPRWALGIERQADDRGPLDAMVGRPGLRAVPAHRETAPGSREEPAARGEQHLNGAIGQPGVRRMPGEAAIGAAEDALLRRAGVDRG